MRSSFSASRKFGLNRQLVDTIFNMNATHLAPGLPTVFETLEATGEASNTLAIFMSDNGLLLGENDTYGKGFPYTFATQIPLMVRGPFFQTGVTNDAIVANVDIAPTILDAADVDGPEMDGRSLMSGFERDRIRSPWEVVVVLQRLKGELGAAPAPKSIEGTGPLAAPNSTIVPRMPSASRLAAIRLYFCTSVRREISVGCAVSTGTTSRLRMASNTSSSPAPSVATAASMDSSSGSGPCDRASSSRTR